MDGIFAVIDGIFNNQIYIQTVPENFKNRLKQTPLVGFTKHFSHYKKFNYQLEIIIN